MKKASAVMRILAMIGILQAAAITQTALAATSVEKYETSGDSIYLYSNSWDDCTHTFLSINAITSAAKNNTPPTQNAGIYVSITNYCTGTYTSGSSVSIPEWFTLEIQNTRSASLKGNLPMRWSTPLGEYIGNAAIDLQWIGAGNTERTSDSTRSHHGNYIVTNRATGIAAYASVAGSISFDGNPLTLANIYARIMNSQTGTMEILRYEGKPSGTSP